MRHEMMSFRFGVTGNCLQNSMARKLSDTDNIQMPNKAMHPTREDARG